MRQAWLTLALVAGTSALGWGGLSGLGAEPPGHVDTRRAGFGAMGCRGRALAASLLPARGCLGTRGHPQALQHCGAQGDRLTPRKALGFRVCTEGERALGPWLLASLA